MPPLSPDATPDLNRHIVALDVATHICGWAVLSLLPAGILPHPGLPYPIYSCGSWNLGKGSVEHRAGLLAICLRDRILNHRPTEIVIERPDYKHATMHNQPLTIQALGIALGVVIGFAAEHAIPIVLRSPQEWRDSLVGLATANKQDVQITLHRRGFTTPPYTPKGAIDYDALDALGLAVTRADELDQAHRLTPSGG